MKKDSAPHTSQDYDRKHQQDHVLHNPRAVKDIPSSEDNETTDSENNGGGGDKSDATAEILAKGHITETSSAKTNYNADERKLVRQEHTNHFTNRARPENQ